jgi:uncharacterized membrane protein
MTDNCGTSIENDPEPSLELEHVEPDPTAIPADHGIKAVLQMEQRSHAARSRIDHISAMITGFAGSGASILFHAVWFSIWLVVNLGGLPEVKPFDPFPFSFLTMIVSLEAIFLTLFVLVSQNRMSQEADKRAHLDLQVNILAERETTLILQMLNRISEKLGVESDARAEISELIQETRIDELARKLDGALPK